MSVNFVGSQKKRFHHYFIPQEANNHRPHFIRHQALHFYSFLIITVKVLSLLLLFVIYPTPAEFSTITSNRIIELTNQERQQAGLPVLRRSKLLDQSAKLKAQDMINYNYFAHNRPEDELTPWEWFKQVGYNYTFAGENLAMSFAEAEDAVRAWMESPTHRANIMNPNYREVGVAVLIGKINGQQTTLVVQHFGRSYLAPQPAEFSSNLNRVQGPQIAGTTQISSGQAIEVSFKDNHKRQWPLGLVYYGQRVLWVLLIFIIINLLLTIFIRIKIQHKPILLHSIFVIIVGLLAVFLHPHFIETVVNQPLKIL